MSKVKMRCARCGKTFKASGSKQTLCSECMAKERLMKVAQKTNGNQPAATTMQPRAHAPKIVGPGAAILVPGAVPAGYEAAASNTGLAAPGHPAEPGRRAGPPATAATEGGRRPQDATARAAGKAQQPGRQRREATQSERVAAPRERKPAPRVFEITDEVRSRIEERYLELARPVEFDGIRARIAEDLGYPKGAVKQVVSGLRQRMQLPSWWELQAYHGNDDDLRRIREAYEPLLPVPPVGVHRQIASSLNLDPSTVYQGIRRIRAEMRLPQYNPPTLHQPGTPVTASTPAQDNGA